MKHRGNLRRLGRNIASKFQAVFFNAVPRQRGKSTGRKYRQRGDHGQVSMQDWQNLPGAPE